MWPAENIIKSMWPVVLYRFPTPGLVVRSFALEAGRLGSILSRVKPKILKLVSAVTLTKRSAIKRSAEDEMNRE